MLLHPKTGQRDTGWDRGYQWYPVGPPGKIADPRGQPGQIGPTCQYHLFAPIPVEYHRSHPSPRKETVQRNEDGIANHDGSLSRGGRLQGNGVAVQGRAVSSRGRHPYCWRSRLLAGRGPVRSDRASWGLHSGDVTGIGGSGALRLRITSSPIRGSRAVRWVTLILRFQLPFVGGDECPNFVRHV